MVELLLRLPAGRRGGGTGSGGKVAGAAGAHLGAWDAWPSPGEGALPRDPAVPPPAASRRAPKASRPRDALNHLPPRDNRAAAEGLTAGCAAAGLLSVHTRDVEKVRWHFRGPGEGGGQERENRVRSRCRLLTCQMAKKMRAAHSTSESM